MCGIVGYVGKQEAAPILLAGLKRVEYRGYDSAGIAVLNGHGVETRKAPGKISKLESLINESPLHGSTGIAHTRWATHGAPTERNAHPHVDEKCEVAVVHNGIIENATALRTLLEQTSRLSRSEAERVVREVVAFFSEPLESFVARRHRELQSGGLRNEVIFERIAVEVAERRFAAPALSERQIRRIVYG